MVVVGDVSTEACNAAMVESATSHFGALHTLVLNAGVAPFGPLEQITPDQLERTFAVNVRGALLGLQAALPEAGLWWLTLGGLAYTAGVVFYVLDLMKRLSHAHGIWHFFVLTGSTCHFVSVIGYVR